MAIYLILSLLLTLSFGGYWDCEFYSTEANCIADTACIYSAIATPSCFANCTQLQPPICDDYGCIEQGASCIVGTTTTTPAVGTPAPVDISGLACSGTANEPPLGRSSYSCDVGNEICRYIDINSNCTNNCGSENAPYPSFQTALDGINQQTVTLIVKPGTYSGVGNYDIYAEKIFLEIRSESGSANTIIDCQGDGFGFHFFDVTIYQMSGFTIQNCVAPERTPWSNLPGYARDNPYIITNSTHSPGRLGGAFFMDRVWSNFSDMVIIDNCAEFGGGIFQYQHSLHLYNSIIEYNYAADSGAGIFALFANAYMYDTLITCNEAEIFGGGIFDYESEARILDGASIADNIAQYANEFYCDKATVHVDTINGGTVYDNNINSWNHNEIVYCCCNNCAFYEGSQQTMNFCTQSNSGTVSVVEPQDFKYEQCIPTLAPTSDPTPSPTNNPTPAPTNNPTPAPTSDPTPAPTGNPTPAPTNNPTPAPSDNPTPAPTDNPTSAPTENPTPAPTNNPTPAPTANPTPAPTENPTPAPTDNPTPAPTENPTPAPTGNPTPAPTENPTPAPSANPTPAPTENPTPAPTNNPTPAPTDIPTKMPTELPTSQPTIQPTVDPTSDPIPAPTGNPTPSPTSDPTPAPTGNPTPAPTDNPTKAPTPGPTGNPTPAPSENPTPSPTNNPSPAPTADPTPAPTGNPTPAPTDNPTPAPTDNPTPSPTGNPSKGPTPAPTNNPSKQPTPSPTDIPTKQPTPSPTDTPSKDPTPAPTSNPSTEPTVAPTTDLGCDNGVVRPPQLGRSSYECGIGESCVYIANNSDCTNNCGSENNPYPTFQSALDGIKQQTLTIIVKPGTYTGEGNRNIYARNIFLNIRSEKGSEETIIDCEGNGYGFHFYQVTVTQMTGLTIQNCHATDRNFIVPSYADNPYISNISQYSNGAKLGGAFFMENTWSNMSDMVIIDNSADFGGGIFQFQQSLNLYNSIIEYNCASSSGGALFLLFANAYLYNTYIQCNSAEIFGGGIFSHQSRTDILDKTIVRDNIAQYGNEFFCDKSTANVDIIGKSLIYDNDISNWEDNEVAYCCCNNCAFFEGPQQKVNFCAASDSSKVNVVEPTSNEECSVRKSANVANNRFNLQKYVIVILVLFLVFIQNI